MRLFRPLRLTTKLTMVAVLSTIVCTLITLVITLVTLQEAAGRQEQEKLEIGLRMAWHLVHERGAELRLLNGKLQAGTAILDGDVALVDGLHALVGGVATVFRGTTRVATNIRLINGRRAIGTELAAGPAYQAVVLRNVQYHGVVDILGQTYVTVYDPIFSRDGKRIGILFVGEKLSSFNAGLRTTSNRILFGGGVAVVLVGIGFSLLASRMFRPLHGMTSAMRSLAAHDLAVEVPGLERGDEIGGMARAVWVFKENAIQSTKRDAELRQTSMQFETALRNMSQGLCLYDGAGHLEVFNQQFCAILGINPNDIRPGMSIRDVLQISQAAGNYPGRDLEEVVAERHAFIARRETGTMVIELANGRLVSIMHCPMTNEGWVATFEDITDRLTADAKISHMARHDTLTGLVNRLVLEERIEQALIETARDGQSAVLCLDLDEFKRVNDTLGHPVGDGLLVAVSERLLACVREGDTVARLGGDEFAIVQLGIARPEDAKLLAERLTATIQQPFLVDGHEIAVGVSIGVALMPTDGNTQTALLKNADIALYRAKAEERGTFCFFEAGMDARLQLRRQLELDLRVGMARGEFELFYQPLVSLALKQVVGFEALLRWHHPERGMVSPAEFIPVMEETGMIVPLGEWVIRQACAEAASWPEHIKVAVNLSPSQFRSRNLVPTVARSLEETGLAASRLELEVTEMLLLQDNESTLAMLHELRALGARISMDDFGTGYSSLSYLRSFPFDKIKIDQSFVRDLSNREDSIHIVRAINGLCAGLGMTTTAEGVETEEQLEKIYAEGCTEVQGYLFSPPRPATEIPALLERVLLRNVVWKGCGSGLNFPAGSQLPRVAAKCF